MGYNFNNFFITGAALAEKGDRLDWRKLPMLPLIYPLKFFGAMRTEELSATAELTAVLCALPAMPFYFSASMAYASYQAFKNKDNPLLARLLALPALLISALACVTTFLPAFASLVIDFVIAVGSYFGKIIVDETWKTSSRYESGSAVLFGAYTGVSIRNTKGKLLSDFSYPLNYRQNIRYRTRKNSWEPQDQNDFIGMLRATALVVLSYPYLIAFGHDQWLHKADVNAKHHAYKIPILLTTPLTWLLGLITDISTFLVDVVGFSPLKGLEKTGEACVNLVMQKTLNPLPMSMNGMESDSTENERAHDSWLKRI